MSDRLVTVISGSFRKHLSQLYILRDELEARRVDVLSPIGSAAINEGEEFIILDNDPIEDHRTLQDAVFAKIRRSSFLTVCNIDGYIGKAATLEIGYAIAHGLQVLTWEPADDPNIAAYSRTLEQVFGPELIEAVKTRYHHAHHR
ncbi:hypothetical protein [Salinarimonas sp.]|uniref:hypothetical protein n=1 Tax=Salinarimonas sp. TaxID=2766526 RepID=UPI0032D9A0E1